MEISVKDFEKLEKEVNRSFIDKYQDLTRPELIELLRADGYLVTEPQLRQWTGDNLIKYEELTEEKKRFRYSAADIERIKDAIILRDLGLSKRKIKDIFNLLEKVKESVNDFFDISEEIPEGLSNIHEVKKYFEGKGLTNKWIKAEIIVTQYLTELSIIRNKVEDKLRVCDNFLKAFPWNKATSDFLQNIKSMMTKYRRQ